MIVIMLLGVFFLIVVLFAAVAYSANTRKRARQSGVDPAASAAGRPTQ